MISLFSTIKYCDLALGKQRRSSPLSDAMQLLTLCIRLVGVGVLPSSTIKCLRVPLPSCTSFEAIWVRLTTAVGPFNWLSIGQVPAIWQRPSSVLEVLVTFSCLVLVGDSKDGANANSWQLHELLASFDMTQQVTDRLITQAGPSDDVSNVQLDEVSVNPADIISRPLLVADACQSGATYRVPGKGSEPTHLGHRSFAAAGSQVWNSLPTQLRVFHTLMSKCNETVSIL